MAKPLNVGLAGARKAAAPDLTAHERIVLSVVCRFPDRAAITTHIAGERQLTQAQWQAARTSLIAKKLLTVAGKVTPAGLAATGEVA